MVGVLGDGDSKRKVSPKKHSKQKRKWLNYILNDIEDVKKEIKALKSKIKKLEEHVKTLEQQCRYKCSGNSSS